MPDSTKRIATCGWVFAAVMACAACAPKRVPPMTVSDLMEDRVTLDGVLMKCNENPIMARTSSDCLNARVAVERLAKDVDPAEEARRSAEFERSREKLRVAQEKLRQEQVDSTKVDPYSLPVVPLDSAAPGAAPSGGALQPGAVAPPSGASPGLAQIKP